MNKYFGIGLFLIVLLLSNIDKIFSAYLSDFIDGRQTVYCRNDKGETRAFWSTERQVAKFMTASYVAFGTISLLTEAEFKSKVSSFVGTVTPPDGYRDWADPLEEEGSRQHIAWIEPAISNVKTALLITSVGCGDGDARACQAQKAIAYRNYPAELALIETKQGDFFEIDHFRWRGGDLFGTPTRNQLNEFLDRFGDLREACHDMFPSSLTSEKTSIGKIDGTTANAR